MPRALGSPERPRRLFRRLVHQQRCPHRSTSLIAPPHLLLPPRCRPSSCPPAPPLRTPHVPPHTKSLAPCAPSSWTISHARALFSLQRRRLPQRHHPADCMHLRHCLARRLTTMPRGAAGRERTRHTEPPYPLSPPFELGGAMDAVILDPTDFVRPVPVPPVSSARDVRGACHRESRRRRRHALRLDELGSSCGTVGAFSTFFCARRRVCVCDT